MKNFKLGLQLYSVRKDMENDFEGTLKKVAEMGYEYVEFAGYFGKTAKEVKELLEKYNLKCISVHQNIDLFLEEGQKAVDYLKTFGVKYAVVPWYAADKQKGTPDWEETVSRFKKVSKLLKENDMYLLYHNHDFEFAKYQDKYLLDWIYEEIGLDCIKPEFDTCWIHYAGVDPCEYMMKYNGHVDIVHLKDFTCKELCGGPAYALIDKTGNTKPKPTRAENDFMFRPLGMGRQNIPEILKTCEKLNAEYLIVEQDESVDRPALEAAKISIDYLKNLLK